ncbi:unnamed protein product [Rhizophagus irregularis]|nr:unnamed protein product [Rhizophagus irregularis]CAB5365779.1 unnamed protein product [Rhizophagus irregularis]
MKLNSILHIFNIAGSSVRLFYAIDGSKEAVKQPNQLIAFTNELNTSNLVNRITILRTVVEKKVLKVDLPYASREKTFLYQICKNDLREMVRCVLNRNVPAGKDAQ